MFVLIAEKKWKRSGQVMLEYIVALGVMLALVVLCAMLLHAFKIHGSRVLSLIATSL